MDTDNKILLATIVCGAIAYGINEEYFDTTAATTENLPEFTFVRTTADNGCFTDATHYRDFYEDLYETTNDCLADMNADENGYKLVDGACRRIVDNGGFNCKNSELVDLATRSQTDYKTMTEGFAFVKKYGTNSAEIVRGVERMNDRTRAENARLTKINDALDAELEAM